MEDKEFTDIISLISKQTGIIPRESHKSGITLGPASVDMM
jgi:chemotaxis protein methyltransferase CheR